MANLHILCAPVGERFGRERLELVEELIHVDAKLGLTQEAAAETEDTSLMLELEADAEALRTEIKALYKKIGPSCMTYVRGIHPHVSRSIWERIRAEIAEDGHDIMDTVHDLEANVAAASEILEERVAQLEEVVADAFSGDEAVQDEEAPEASEPPDEDDD